MRPCRVLPINQTTVAALGRSLEEEGGGGNSYSDSLSWEEEDEGQAHVESCAMMDVQSSRATMRLHRPTSGTHPRLETPEKTRHGGRGAAGVTAQTFNGSNKALNHLLLTRSKAELHITEGHR